MNVAFIACAVSISKSSKLPAIYSETSVLVVVPATEITALKKSVSCISLGELHFALGSLTSELFKSFRGMKTGKPLLSGHTLPPTSHFSEFQGEKGNVVQLYP